MVQQHSRAAPPRGFVSDGSAPPTESITLRIALANNNLNGLESKLLAISDPSSSEYGQFLTPEEVSDYQLIASDDSTGWKIVGYILLGTILSHNYGVQHMGSEQWTLTDSYFSQQRLGPIHHYCLRSKQTLRSSVYYLHRDYLKSADSPDTQLFYRLLARGPRHCCASDQHFYKI